MDTDLIRQTAQQGDSLSQYILGNMYVKGVGVPKDFSKAMAWFREAAIQNHAGAQLKLGMFLLVKCMVAKEHDDFLEEAQKWLYRAEGQGMPEAVNLKPKYVLERGDWQDLMRMIEEYSRVSTLKDNDWVDFFKQMKK